MDPEEEVRAGAERGDLQFKLQNKVHNDFDDFVCSECDLRGSCRKS